MSEPIMTREEVAEYLGIKPESVRSALRNYGIKEQRGYLRNEIESLQRKGRGYRSDLDERTHDDHRPDNNAHVETRHTRRPKLD